MIYIVSKVGCDKCVSCKKHLKDMGYEFEEHDEIELQGVDSTLTPAQKADLLTEYIMSGTLPILWFKDRAWSMTAAMKELKK